MPTNPTITEDRHTIERPARALPRHVELQQLMQIVREHWLYVATPSAKLPAPCDSASQRIVLCVAAWSLNQDPQRPKLVT